MLSPWPQRRQVACDNAMEKSSTFSYNVTWNTLKSLNGPLGYKATWNAAWMRKLKFFNFCFYSTKTSTGDFTWHRNETS